MSVAAQARSRRKAATARRNHGLNYTQRRNQLGTSALGTGGSTFAGKISKTAKKSAGR